MPGASQTRATWLWFALIISIGCVLLLVGLGETEFRLYDEGLYGKLARHATAHETYLYAVDGDGEFQPKFSKPPLTIWLVVASFKLLGPSLFALRLPFALGMLALVAVTFGWGRRIAGLPMAIAWSLCLLATAATLRWGRHACIEPLFLAPTLGALWAYHEALVGGRGPTPAKTSRRFAILAGVLLAASFMTKQLAVGLAVFPIVGLEVLRRDRTGARGRLLPTLGIPLATAMVWFAATYRAVGPVALEIVTQGVGQRMQGFESGHNARSLAELSTVLDEASQPFFWPLGCACVVLLVVASAQSQPQSQPQSRSDWRHGPPQLLLPLFFVGLVLAYANLSSSMLPWYAADFVAPLCGGLAWGVALSLQPGSERHWSERAAATVAIAAAATGTAAAAGAVMSPLNAAVLVAIIFVAASVRPRLVVPAWLGVAAFLLLTRARHEEFNTAPGPFTNLMEPLAQRGVEHPAVSKSAGLLSVQYITFFGASASIARAPWHTGKGDAWIDARDLPIEYTPPQGTEILRTPGGIAAIGGLKTAPWDVSTVSELLAAGPVTFEAEHLAAGRRQTISADPNASGGQVRRFAPFRTEAISRFSLVAGPNRVSLEPGRYKLDLYATWGCGGTVTDALRVTVENGKSALARKDLECDESPTDLDEPTTLSFRVGERSRISITVRYQFGDVTVDRLVLRRL